MDDLKLLVSPSPHVRDTDTTEKIMFAVLIALLPVVAAAIYFFRWDAVRVLLLSAGSAVATETIWQRLRRKPIRIGDGSALITGVLLALSLPPTIPSWMVIVGSAFAIAIGKQVFGGLGHNPFNPALVGRAFMLASFSQAMTKWTPPIDGVSAATPLALGAAVSRVPDLFFGSVAGSLGETSALAILLDHNQILIVDIVGHPVQDRIANGIRSQPVCSHFRSSQNRRAKITFHDYKTLHYDKEQRHQDYIGN